MLTTTDQTPGGGPQGEEEARPQGGPRHSGATYQALRGDALALDKLDAVLAVPGEWVPEFLIVQQVAPLIDYTRAGRTYVNYQKHLGKRKGLDDAAAEAWARDRYNADREAADRWGRMRIVTNDMLAGKRGRRYEKGVMPPGTKHEGKQAWRLRPKTLAGPRLQAPSSPQAPSLAQALREAEAPPTAPVVAQGARQAAKGTTEGQTWRWGRLPEEGDAPALLAAYRARGMRGAVEVMRSLRIRQEPGKAFVAERARAGGIKPKRRTAPRPRPALPPGLALLVAGRDEVIAAGQAVRAGGADAKEYDLSGNGPPLGLPLGLERLLTAGGHEVVAGAPVRDRLLALLHRHPAARRDPEAHVLLAEIEALEETQMANPSPTPEEVRLRLTEHRLFWAALPRNPAEQIIRDTAVEVQRRVTREAAEAERGLRLTGRTLRLPKEEPGRVAREQALLEVLDLLQDVAKAAGYDDGVDAPGDLPPPLP